MKQITYTNKAGKKLETAVLSDKDAEKYSSMLKREGNADVVINKVIEYK